VKQYRIGNFSEVPAREGRKVDTVKFYPDPMIAKKKRGKGKRC